MSSMPASSASFVDGKSSNCSPKSVSSSVSPTLFGALVCALRTSALNCCGVVVVVVVVDVDSCWLAWLLSSSLSSFSCLHVDFSTAYASGRRGDIKIKEAASEAYENKEACVGRDRLVPL